MKRRIVSAILVATMVVTAMAGCGKSASASGSGDAAATNTGSSDGAATTEASAEGATYTWHDTIGAINTFSPTDWQLNDESALFTYCSSELWAFIVDKDNEKGWNIVPELATDYPVDVTAEYAGNETYGVPADATEGYAYKVTIRQDAKWDDGTPITTADYEYSLKQYLNPEMKNYRASSYYDQSPLANAKAYYGGGQAIAADYITSLSELVPGDPYTTASGAPVYFTLDDTLSWMSGASLSEYYGAGYDALDAAIDTLSAVADDNGYAPVNDETIAALYAFTGSADWGNESEDDLLNYMTYTDESTKLPWESVGFVKNDDYTFTLVLAKTMSEFYFEYNFSSLTLLKEDLYEANKQETGGVVKSSYGTSVDKFASYGPYKMTEYQEGKAVKLTKNDNWYGYTDGQHEGLYQTTDIDLQQIDEHTTQLSMFLQGNLDTVGLSSDDMEAYGTSDFVYFQPETYTQAFAINTDIDMLKSREEENQNKSILTYIDFRKAISLAYDRNNYVKSCTAAYDASYGLLNTLYVYDPETMSKYRDTEVAKQVLCEVYDADSIDELTGYNVAEASALLQSAYDQCYADGNIDDDDIVTIDYSIYGSDSIYQKMVDFLQDSLDAAAVGTSLEGRIKVNLVEDQDYYTSMINGEDDLITEMWGGADMDPYSLIQVYTDPSYITEFGFDPNANQCTINVNGEEKTMSFFDWYTELSSGEYALADTDTRNAVLAGMEKGLLLDYHVIPLAARTSAILYSQRVILTSDVYVNSLVGFGSIRDYTYSMSDEEWTAYCAEQNNQLTY